MQNTDLQREGATLLLRPPLSASSTQRDNVQEKDQESQIHDQDLSRHKMEQGRSEAGEELGVDTVGRERLMLDLNPHHSDETYIKREECHGGEEETSDSTSSESGG